MLLSNFIAVSIYHNAAYYQSLLLASALVFFYALFNLTLAVLIAVDKAKEGTIIYPIYAFVQLFASVALGACRLWRVRGNSRHGYRPHNSINSWAYTGYTST